MIRIDVPGEQAEVALQRIRPLINPALRVVIAPMFLDQLALSCYQQGLFDGLQLSARPELRALTAPAPKEPK